MAYFHTDIYKKLDVSLVDQSCWRIAGTEA